MKEKEERKETRNRKRGEIKVFYIHSRSQIVDRNLLQGRRSSVNLAVLVYNMPHFAFSSSHERQ